MSERETVAAGRRDASPRRLDPLAVRRELREEGLRARREFSQNFLADPDVLEAIVDLAAPEPGSRILEVGPGLGILTGALLAGGADITAVELDRRLARRLRERHEGSTAATSGALRVVEGDILDQEIADLIEPPYEVVANIPYHITSPILHRFLGAPPRPERLVLMVQREVAERIAAAPGAMSYLSVFVQYHAAVRIAFTVPRTAFEPEPDVDSAVVELRPYEPASGGASAAAAEAESGGAAGGAGAAGRDGAAGESEANARGRPGGPSLGRPSGLPLDPDAENDLWRLVQAGFRERRKMLRNVLVRQLPIGSAAVDTALAASGIDGQRRPQTLSVQEWLDLRSALGWLPGDRRGRRLDGPEAP